MISSVPRRLTLVALDGMESEMYVIVTDIDSMTVSVKPFFSPLSMGRRNTNGPRRARRIIGSTMLMRKKW